MHTQWEALDRDRMIVEFLPGAVVPAGSIFRVIMSGPGGVPIFLYEVDAKVGEEIQGDRLRVHHLNQALDKTNQLMKQAVSQNSLWGRVKDEFKRLIRPEKDS